MKPIFQFLALVAVGLVIAYLHPFQLVMPWQGGEPGPVNAALSDIMDGTSLTYVEADWGRATPFNYVSATGGFEGRADPVATCTDLRLRLDRWGAVTEIERRDDGCDIEATGPGPMVATITVVPNPELRNDLRVDIEVQHRS
jgi:hypothetical protein